MPETDVPRHTIPATPSAIAAEIEPLIERATKSAADYVLLNLEGRLTKIEHQLALAAKHDALLMTEIMDLKMRMDNHATRIERLEAQLVMRRPPPTPVPPKEIKRKRRK